MAHEIDMTNGIGACMVAGEAAWHKLGINVEQAVTSQAAIKLAGLDWHVEQWPVRAYDAETQQSIHVPNKVALVRSDSKAVLSVMTEAYQPLQNSNAFSFMDSLVEEGTIKYETAGALKEGRKIWMLAKLPITIDVAGSDVQLPYLMLTNSHDGSSSVRVHPTAIRVVCNNTLSLATNSIGANAGISFFHTGDLLNKIDSARNAIQTMTTQFQTFGKQANALAARKVNTRDVIDFVNKLYPKQDDKNDTQRKAKRNRIINLMDDAPQQLPGIKGSAWALLNATTQYIDHDMTATGNTTQQRDENRLHSMWFGRGNKIKSQAFQNALALGFVRKLIFSSFLCRCYCQLFDERSHHVTTSAHGRAMEIDRGFVFRAQGDRAASESCTSDNQRHPLDSQHRCAMA